MLLHSTAGPSLEPATQGLNPVPAGTLGEPTLSRLLPDYYHLTKAGMVWAVNIYGNAATWASFSGGAGGQPLFGLFNPFTSPVDLVPINFTLAVKAYGSIGVESDSAVNFWMADQGTTPITGVQTNPINCYSLAKGASFARAMVNVVNAGAKASSLVVCGTSQGALNGSTVTGPTPRLISQFNGMVVVKPAGYFAAGIIIPPATNAILSATLVWAEIPK